jgi:peroxiredoxin (alkyl hydroperoxide reductase subunit C)
MALQLGDTVPNFTADSTAGEIDFYQYGGDNWTLLFSHPADYTPICTTELGAFAKRKAEFEQRNVKIIGVSVDPVASHTGWAADIEETQGTRVNYPILADPERKVAALYGMIHPNADPKVTVRTVFVIDPAKKLRLTLTYPPSTGRSVDEILRVIDSLQLTDNYKVGTPVEWKQGEDVVISASLGEDEAHELFPRGWETQKSYLRVTAQPPQTG